MEAPPSMSAEEELAVGMSESALEQADDPLYMVNAQLLDMINPAGGKDKSVSPTGTAIMHAAAAIAQHKSVIKTVLASNAHIDQYDGETLRGYAVAIDPSALFDNTLHPGPLVGCTAVFALDEIPVAKREAMNKALRDADIPAQLSVAGAPYAPSWTNNGGTADRAVVMEPFPCAQQAVVESSSQFPGDAPDVLASTADMPGALLIVSAHIPEVDELIRTRASTEGWQGQALTYFDMVRKTDIFKYAYGKTLAEVQRISTTVIADAADYLHLSGGPEPVAVWWSDTISITSEPLKEIGKRAAVYYCDTIAGAVTANGAGESGWLYSLSPSQGAVWLRGQRSATSSTLGYGRITSNANALDMLVSGAPPMEFATHAPVLDDDAVAHWPGIDEELMKRVVSTVHSSAEYPVLESALPLDRASVDVHAAGARLAFSKLGHEASAGHVHLRTLAAVLSAPPAVVTHPGNYEYALTHSAAGEFRVPLTRELVDGMLDMHGFGVGPSEGVWASVGNWFNKKSNTEIEVLVSSPDVAMYKKLGPNNKARLADHLTLDLLVPTLGEKALRRITKASTTFMQSIGAIKYNLMTDKHIGQMARFFAVAQNKGIRGAFTEHSKVLTKALGKEWKDKLEKSAAFSGSYNVWFTKFVEIAEGRIIVPAGAAFTEEQQGESAASDMHTEASGDADTERVVPPPDVTTSAGNESRTGAMPLSQLFAGENTADGTITLSRTMLATLVRGGHVKARGCCA